MVLALQLQIMPSEVTSTWHTETKPPGSFSNPKHSQAFLQEAQQLLSRWVQLEAQVPIWTDWHRTLCGKWNLPSDSFFLPFEVSFFSCAGHLGKWNSDQWKLPCWCGSGENYLKWVKVRISFLGHVSFQQLIHFQDTLIRSRSHNDFPTNRICT